MDTDKKRWSCAKIIFMSIVLLISLALIVAGILAALGGSVLNCPFIIMFFLCPASLSVGMFFLLRSRKGLAQKIILGILLVLLTLVILLTFQFFGDYYFDFEDTGEAAIAAYTAAMEDNPEFLEVTELGHYSAIEYHEVIYLFAIFYAESDVLICQYDEAEYLQQKALLEERFVFRTQPVSTPKYTQQPEVSVGSYHFRLLDKSEAPLQRLSFPKDMFFIATNDAACEIVYLSYYDPDIDYIVDMEKHILNDCGWKYVR